MHPSHGGKRRRAPAARGFTLLEVMVAVAILGLGLTAILSAQAGAFASAARTRHLSFAIGLARCKMSEIEERLLREGFQEMDENDAGPCCDDEDVPGMRCAWRVEKLELPEPEYGKLDLNSGLDMNTPSGGTAGMPDLGPLSAISQGSQGKDVFSDSSSLTDIAQTLAGPESSGEGAAGAMDGMTGMVMSLVYPSLKTIFEVSTRRITVTVTWDEGNTEQSMEVAQWVSSSAGLVGDVLDPEAAGTGTGTGTGTGQPPPGQPPLGQPPRKGAGR